MDRSRVVRVRRHPPTGDGPPFRFGSGYVLREGQVLTAAHVLIAADKNLGEDDIDTVRVGDRCAVATWDVLKAAETDDAIVWVDAAVLAVDPKSDVAVIAVEQVGVGLPPVRFGRLDTDAVVKWEAIGFPAAGITERGRQPERARGEVDSVTMEFDERLGTTLNSRELRDVAGISGWSGLSGAAIFVDSHLIGVVVKDPPSAEESLEGVRITKALKHVDVGHALEGLVVEPVVAIDTTTADEAEVTRVVGDRVSGAVTKWQDRNELRQWLRDMLLNGQRITSIIGRPGIGKSAVVAKVLADFEQPDPARSPTEDLDGLVYLSTRTGVAALTPAHVYESVAALAGPEEAERLALKWDNLKLEAFSSLWNAMRRRRVVVVLDHLDDVQNQETLELTDPGLVALLQSVALAPDAPRVVTTSRQRLALPPELLANVQIRELADGLGPGDGVALLRSFPDANGTIGVESDERLAQVVSLVDGVPHGLELVASNANSDRSFIGKLLTSTEAPDTILEKLVSQNYGNLDDPGRHVVGLLAMARVPLPEPEVPTLLAGLVEASVAADTLGRLIDARTVGFEPKPAPEPGLVRLHPLDADFVRTSLIRDDEALQICLDTKLADWYQSLRTRPSSWRSITDAAPNVREFDHRWRAAREPHEYSEAVAPLAEAAIQIARKGEARRLFAAIKAVEGKVTEPVGLLRVEQCRMWAEFFGGSLERAEAAARKTVELAKTEATPSVAAEMQLRLAEVLRHRGNAAEAATLLQDLLHTGDDSMDRSTKFYALFELGLSSCYLGNWDAAEAAADQLGSLVAPDDEATLKALEYDVRSLARLGARDCDGAISAATVGIAIYAESASQDNAGYLQNVRGLARMYQNDLDAAEREFKDGTLVATQYGQARLEGLCAINLAWCSMSKTNWSEALALASHAAECLTLVSAKEQTIAAQLVSALKDERREPAPLLEMLNAAALGSRENADLYSPSEDLIGQLAPQLAARQGIT